MVFSNHSFVFSKMREFLEEFLKISTNITLFFNHMDASCDQQNCDLGVVGFE